MTLREYRKKRDFARTREPAPRKPARRKTRPIFVVQHHLASREHWDFRLEHEGVLKSWAVPKEPLADPAVKRLAVEVEDHPLAYAKFHGRIPAGQYGAGTVAIWDRGTWRAESDPGAALAEGKLAFELFGRKLRGRWVLVRMKPTEKFKGDRNWLLFAQEPLLAPRAPARRSRRGVAARATARRRRAKKPAAERPTFIAPQLATLEEAAPSGPGWVHEVKLDGYRVELVSDGLHPRLYTRSGADWTARFPTVERAALGLPPDPLVIDGEVVALSAHGRPSFHALQNSLEESSRARIEYHVFDLLSWGGRDLRGEPLSLRRRALEVLVGKPRRGAVIRLCERITARDPLASACRRGLEGVVSKRDDAPYESRRSRAWIKSKCGRRQEFVVAGFTEPQGARGGLGALLLAVGGEGGALEYAGKVGAGFSHAELAQLRARLSRLERARSPLGAPPRQRPGGIVHWVRPVLAAEVSFTEWTPDGLLRHPVFHALREDQPVASIRREKSGVSGDEGAVVAGVRITHPDRVVFPKSRLSKLELARYYASVAKRMLPHLADRPLSILRCPEGQGGTCFFQKHWSGNAPGVATVEVREGGGARRSYATARDAQELVTLVQYGAIEFHPWGSRADRIDAPDRITFDLDPGPGVPWKRIVESAFAVRDLLRGLGLASWLKTSGGKGLHVVVPLAQGATWDVVASFSKAVAARLARGEPERYVATMAKAARRGRIFVDALRNTRGATAVAPYSARARAEAGVSMPIRWADAAKLGGGDRTTLANAAARLRGADPWKGFARAKNRITLAAARRLLDGG